MSHWDACQSSPTVGLRTFCFGLLAALLASLFEHHVGVSPASEVTNDFAG